MSANGNPGTPGPERGKARLDQWLWFARFAKTRSLAARLCTAGAVLVNGAAATKPNHTLRVGDFVVVPQGRARCQVRVLALGSRRGPAVEARTLYEELTVPPRLADPVADWVPLLAEDEPSGLTVLPPAGEA